MKQENERLNTSLKEMNHFCDLERERYEHLMFENEMIKKENYELTLKNR